MGVAAEPWGMAASRPRAPDGLVIAGMLILGQLEQKHESGASCSDRECLQPPRLPTASKLPVVDVQAP